MPHSATYRKHTRLYQNALRISVFCVQWRVKKILLSLKYVFKCRVLCFCPGACHVICKGWEVIEWSDCESHSANLRFRDPSEAGVQVQVLPPRQQFIYGIKLRTVAHVLVHIQYVGENTEEKPSSWLALTSNGSSQLVAPYELYTTCIQLLKPPLTSHRCLRSAF